MNAIEEILGDTKLDSVGINDGDKDECSDNLEKFALKYFPHIFTKTLCRFHKETFLDAQNMILGSRHRQKYFVRAAPRGFGKSRIISVVLPIWCIVYKYRVNILLIADTNAQSKEYIGTIKSELEGNQQLRNDFGHLESDRKWSEDEIITANMVHVIAKSSGQSLRGSSFNNVRPELVVLDDLENDELVETEGQRTKLRKWFTKVVMPIGNERTSFLYVGSILHYESLLNRILTRPEYANWNRRIYKAIYDFSDSPLWEEWKEIFTDLSNERASDDAEDFFVEHREEMLKGTRVLWPEWRTNDDGTSMTYYDLMIQKLQDDDAFNSEYQNNPMTEETRIFKEKWIQENYYAELPAMKAIYGSVDLSMGKTRTADTSAIIFVGQGIDNYFYVLEADVARRSPNQIIEDIIGLILKYEKELTGFVVETNVFQEFFANTLEKTCVDMGLYVNWIERKSVSGENKMLRIKSLAPKIKLGYIKFNKAHRALENQLKDFPKSNDDAPDALEMCITQFVVSNCGLAITKISQHKGINLNKVLKGWFKRA